MKYVRITLEDNLHNPVELYFRVGLIDDNYRLTNWGENGGLASMLKEADKIRKLEGESRTVEEEFSRVYEIAKKRERKLIGYQITVNVEEKE